jgi:hypothetical protein
MARTDDIAHRIAEYLARDLAGFRYIRSCSQLRAAAKPYVDDIIINVTTSNAVSYSLAFYMGVQHTEIESIIAEAEDRKVGPYDRTIFQYSPNVGKQNQLPYDGPSWWWGLPHDTDLSDIRNEIRNLVREFALPYHSRFHDLETIRESLASRDGLSLNMFPFKQVLAIDAFLSDSQHLVDYLKLLQAEVDSGYHHRCDAFNEYYSRLSTHYSMFPEFQLIPKAGRTIG